MDILDILTIVASFLFIAGSFTVSPRMTLRRRRVIAVLLAFVAVVTFFRGSPWARLDGVSILFAAVVFAMSAHRMAKTNSAART
jgi:Ca2+/Na+ antiporter